MAASSFLIILYEILKFWAVIPANKKKEKSEK